MKSVHRLKITDPVKAKSDPRGGWIKHKVKDCNRHGQEKPLSPADQTRYNHRRRNFADADFHLHRRGLVRIVFKIADQAKGRPQWQFRGIPLTIQNMPKGASLWRSTHNHKKAVLIFRGVGNSIGRDFKYTLHYEDENGNNAFDHDPIIRTGDAEPPNFLAKIVQTIFGLVKAIYHAVVRALGYL